MLNLLRMGLEANAEPVFIQDGLLSRASCTQVSSMRFSGAGTPGESFAATATITSKAICGLEWRLIARLMMLRGCIRLWGASGQGCLAAVAKTCA